MKNPVHLKAFQKFISRNKLYTAINIFGFAVSLTFVILLGFYIQRENSIDAFQQNKDRIFRLEQAEGARFTGAVAPALQDRYPEIERITRITETYDLSINISGQEPIYSRAWAIMTDSNFFSMFSFPFTEGHPHSALQTKDEVVLTESYARQLFGSEPALGKTLLLEPYGGEFLVSGVVKDLKDTHFDNPSLFFRIENLNDWWNVGKPGITERFDYNFIGIYIQTRPGSDLRARVGDIETYFRDGLAYPMFVEGRAKEVSLKPLQEIYFNPMPETLYARSNSRSYMTVLVVVALVILAFAVINYINLSVAQAGFRAKSASLRRLLGGTRSELFLGFIAESVILCTLSLLVAIGLAFGMEPFFRQLLVTDITVAGGLTAGNIALMLGGILVLGILSGIIPAAVVAGFKPIEVVRGTFQRQTKMVYSKALISFQYCITIILIGCTLTVMSQVKYMLAADKGFDTDHILFFNNPFRTASEQMAFRNRLMAVSGVEQVALAEGGPTIWGHSMQFQDMEGANHEIIYYAADSNFMSVMDFEVVHRTGVAATDGWWINETTWRRWGLQDGDIEYRAADDRWFRIAGVVRDFHVQGFDKPIGEAGIFLVSPDERKLSNLYVRVSAGDPFGTRDRIASLYKEMTGGKLMDATFFDEWIEFSYQQQKRMVKIMGTLSVLAIIISSMGMLAMATYFARQRAQEVAVRKVFGAMTRQVLLQLMNSFLKLVMIAFVIAVPVIVYVMREWLATYVYRISLSWTIFAMAGLTALTIAALTVFWQSAKVANLNPVISLKDK